MLNQYISSRNNLITLLASVLVSLLLLNIISDQLHLWPLFRRPAFLDYSTSEFSDNIAGLNLQDELRSYLPIDVVYTWVNGSDPSLIQSLTVVRRRLIHETNHNSSHNILMNANITNANTRNVEFITSNGKCILKNCVPFNVLVLSYRPGLALAMKRNDTFLNIDPRFIEKVIQSCETPDVCPEVVTFVKMNSIRDVYEALSQNVSYKEEIVPATGSFVTSQKVINSIPLTNYYIIHGSNINSSVLIDHLNHISSPRSFSIVSYHDNVSHSIVIYKVISDTYNADLVTETNTTSFSIFAARIVWNSIQDMVHVDLDAKLDDYSSNRFQDNEELRFSIRSVIKYAPWIRKIYIVTNGQIPYWLDLSHPRVTIIPHYLIFQNLSHLPTFSSPAIESHLHRIPGLSKKFLYMNDDVMLGQCVHPDDFYSETKGQKVYLSWSVPNCLEGCPPSWIGDGYCDSACNHTECDFDGGDCNLPKTREGFGRWGFSEYSHYSQDTSGYCAPGCANSWMGDRYCDSSCFMVECAFDGGDCGTTEFFRIHYLPFRNTNSTQYIYIPSDISAAYLNFSESFPKGDNWTLLSGYFISNDSLRTVVYSEKHHLLTLTFYTSLPFAIENSTIYLTFSQEGTGDAVSILSIIIYTASNGFAEQDSFFSPELFEFTKMVENSLSVNGEDQSYFSSPTDGKIYFGNQTFQADYLSISNDSKRIIDILLAISEIEEIVKVKLNQISAKYQEGLFTNSGFVHRVSTVLKLLPMDTLQYISSISNSQIPIVPNDIFNLNAHITLRRPQITLKSLNSVHGNFMKSLDLPARGFSRYHNRNILDTFGESLKHVNRLFNKRYGHEARKVPAHMPHLIDREVMEELQNFFREEYLETSSHQVRQSNDMQYSFSYYYFYISETLDSISLRKVFDDVDTDENGILSILEQRNLVALLKELPLSSEVMNSYYAIINRCSNSFNGTPAQLPKHEFPSHYGENMPLVDIDFFVNCEELIEFVKLHYSLQPKRKFEIMNEDNIAFKMINQNSSKALGQLDWIRKNRRKFICINDNIDHSAPSAMVVKSLIREFYISMFPTPSPFELPNLYRNRFSSFDEYMQWQSQKKYFGMLFQLVIILNFVLMILVIFYDKFKRKCKFFSWILFKMLTRKQKKYNYQV